VGLSFELKGSSMRVIGKAVDACEYGRGGGLMGWAQEHSLVFAVAAVCGWLVVCYAVFSAFTTLG
jgi:hypothetical protein